LVSRQARRIDCCEHGREDAEPTESGANFDLRLANIDAETVVMVVMMMVVMMMVVMIVPVRTIGRRSHRGPSQRGVRSDLE
jgi:hypothetical protein